MAYKENVQTYAVANTTGLLSQGNQNIPPQELFYEIELAIVTKVYSDEFSGKVRIKGVFSKKELDAYPLHQSIKIVPLVGELILFREYKLGKGSSYTKYFYETLSWFNSVHVNDFPEVLQYLLEDIKTTQTTALNIDSVPGQSDKQKQSSIGSYYIKNDNLYNNKIFSFEGNTIFEGRNGQSIRFGNTIPSQIKFNSTLFKKSNWMFSKNDITGGNPFTIISNGKSNIDNNFSLEDLQNDPATIFLGKGGADGINIPFLLSSINKPLDTTIPSTYNDSLILLNSERLIFNSFVSDITISAQNNLIGMSNKNIYFKTKNKFEIASSTINLGEKASQDGQPVVRATDLVQFLQDMIDAIFALKYDNYGFLIPGTDFQMKQLQNTLKNTLNPPAFVSRTSFTL